jgi:hypothetical protein
MLFICRTPEYIESDTTMNKQTLTRFRTEIRHFYLVSLLNLVFAALAIAFGVSYIVTAVFGQAAYPAIPGLRVLAGAIALICSGLGISWIVSTVRVFGGVEAIRDDLEAAGERITDDRITCLIVRMLAHYRDNRRTIHSMILVCTLGGCGFFVLGFLNSLKALSFSPGGFGITTDNLLAIPAMLLTLGIALASLLSSYYFSRFAKDWDQRLHEIEESECALKRTLGLDEA